MRNALSSRRSLVLIAFCVSVLAGAQSTPQYEVQATKNVMIPMRDGIKLATDIYRPAQNGTAVVGRFPAVLVRTPYTRAFQDKGNAAFWVPRGYVFVVQSVRGRYGSEGHWRFFRDDPADGYDAIAWIASQPWSDGNVGMLGGSYDGGTQHAAALASPPALKAMVPLVAATNVGRYGLRHNGAFELRFFTWVFSLGNPIESPLYPAYYPGDAATQAALAEGARNYKQYMMQLPFRPGTTPLKLAPDYDSELAEIMSHGDYDAYWKNVGVDVLSHLKEHKDIPIHHVSGWYDSWDINTANVNYANLARTKKSPQRLTMGPWTHNTLGTTVAGEAEFGPEAKVDLQQLEISWINRWLKGIQNGADKEGPVRIFVMGGGDAHKTPEGRIFVGGHWRTEKEWPLKRAVTTPYYLHPDHTLGPDKPKTGKPSQYDFDPGNPVPSVGGNVSSQMGAMQAGAFDQHCRSDVLGCKDHAPLSSRKDVVVFQSAPLAEDLEVTGSVVVTLWASSSALDTDFTAKLVDVYPPSKDFPEGVELNIGDSIVRARYRDSLERATLMKPGQIYKFRIELYPTSILFVKGHRIRVDISSSNFPRFDVNPNTGEPLNQNTKTAVAINTIYHDPKHPSNVILPVIPKQ
ncbi:MAG TPA: CocE/NonD family hydrolase [Candidatus Angelobacter sp.]